MACDKGMCSSRRDLLKMGAVGLTWGFFGLTLPNMLFMREAFGVTPVNPFYDAVIQIFYEGGPSQTDTWDPKPGSQNNVFNTIDLGKNDIYGQPIKLAEHFVDLTALVQGDPAIGLGLVRSVTHGNGDHGEAQSAMNCFWGNAAQSGQYPSTAAVMAYYFQGQGIGIPSVVISGDQANMVNDAKGGQLPTALEVDASQGVQGNPTVEELTLPAGVDAKRYARRRRLMEAVNSTFLAEHPDASVKAYDKAWKDAYDIATAGQAAKAFDLTGKPILTGGANANTDALSRFTLAQELVKAGVPYLSVAISGNDTHTDNRANVAMNWGDTTDKAVAQMAKNLKATGKRVLIVMGGEFGRTPDGVQGGRDGRDHYPDGFSWAFLSVNQPKFKTTAIGDTGPDGMFNVNDNTLKDPIYPRDLGGLIYKSMGFDVGNSTALDVPTAARLAPPVDRVNNSVTLMQKFGLV